MRLGRALLGTVLTFIALAIVFSVIQGWSWPIVGTSVTVGIIAAGVVGLVACVASGWTSRLSESTWTSDPWLISGMVLGLATLAAAVIGIFTGTTLYLVLFMVGIGLLWLFSTVHFMLTSEPEAGRHLPTPA